MDLYENDSHLHFDSSLKHDKKEEKHVDNK